MCKISQISILPQTFIGSSVNRGMLKKVNDCVGHLKALEAIASGDIIKDAFAQNCV